MGRETVETAVKTTLRTLVIKGNKEIYPQRMRDQGGVFWEEKY